MQNYSTTNAQQGIANMNIQKDANLPQPEAMRRENYSKAEAALATESVVEFSKEGFKYQGGELLLKKFKEDTERIINAHPKGSALMQIWNGASLWATNPPYEIIDAIIDSDTELVVQPEMGVRKIHREWPTRKTRADGSAIPNTPEQDRWVEYVNNITSSCSDPRETIKIGAKNQHAYTDVNVANLCKTAHAALASILIDRCELGAFQALQKLGHENIHLANDVLTRANTANKEVTDEQLITKLQMGNPFDRVDFYNKPQQGMQPWESVIGWFEKIDSLIMEIIEVSRVAGTVTPSQISDASLVRMLEKHLTPVYKDVIAIMQLTAKLTPDAVLSYEIFRDACIMKSKQIMDSLGNTSFPISRPPVCL